MLRLHWLFCMTLGCLAWNLVCRWAPVRSRLFWWALPYAGFYCYDTGFAYYRQWRRAAAGPTQ